MAGGYCLPKEAADDLKKALKAGKVKPSEMTTLSSEERRAIFERYMNPMQAQNTNALFESKLLLKNQQRGMISWAKKVTGITPETRRDLVAKVQRLDRALNQDELDVFLEDLIQKRLGFNVTPEEAELISKMAGKVEEARVRIREDSPINSPERLRYGSRAEAFKNYVDELKEGAKDKRLSRYLNPIKSAELVGGISKSIVATLDNSFFGNQGVNILFTNPDIWVRRLVNSFADISKALGGGDPLKLVHADIISRPNSLNGKYRAMGADLDILSEEAFPNPIPGKIPVLGRLYKASEAAYNGAALRIRADYADRIIKTAERNGIDMTDPEVAQGFGRLVNYMTGRGHLGPLEAAAQPVNAILFSARFLRSNIDVLTAGLLEPGIRGNKVAMAIAAGNTVKIIAGIAGVLAIADRLMPGSVDWKTNSSGIGQIRVGATTFNVTGGKAALMTLASRLVPQWDEELGRWVYKTTGADGKERILGTGEFGNRTGLDVAEAFLEGKLSPLAGLIRDLWKSEFYDRTPFTFKEGGLNLVTPIPIQTADDLLNTPDAAPFLASILLASLGIGVNTYER